ncbi:MAG: Hsp70 family protein [Bacteroidales bacterium]|nr:Hsp70 family protein [Bacteroidales bacterium]
MQNNIVKILYQRFESLYGFSLPNNPTVHKRINEAARKAIVDINKNGTANVNIPFIHADKNGPKHLMTLIKKDEVENFNIFAQTHQTSNNSSSTFINNVHNNSSQESDPTNYLKSIMLKRDKEKRSENKSSTLFLLILILILGGLFFAASQIFGLF